LLHADGPPRIAGLERGFSSVANNEGVKLLVNAVPTPVMALCFKNFRLDESFLLFFMTNCL